MVHLTYTCGCFFLTPIVAGIHLVDGALESPSGWSAGVVWVGSGVARAVSVSGSICGGGGGEMGLGWGVGWSAGVVWVGVGSSEVHRCVGPCASEWVNRWG
jgi:hypothetical protein